MNDDLKSGPAPRWKAPETLLPNVMAAVAAADTRKRPVVRRAQTLLTVIPLCAGVAAAGAVLFGLVSLPSLSVLLGPVLDGYTFLVVMVNTAASVLKALNRHWTLSLVLFSYAAFVLSVGLGGMGGLAALLRQNREQGGRT